MESSGIIKVRRFIMRLSRFLKLYLPALTIILVCVVMVMAEERKEVGYIFGIKGSKEVYIKNKDGTRAATELTLLFDGDILECKKDCALSIVLKDGRKIDLNGPNSYHIPADLRNKKSNVKENLIKIIERIKRKVMSSTEIGDEVVIGGLKGGELSSTITQFTPRERVRDSNFAFRWEAIEGARGYLVKLYNSNDESLLWEGRSNENYVKYNGKELNRGDSYYWIIEADMGKDEKLVSGRQYFTVISSSENELIRKEEREINETLKEMEDRFYLQVLLGDTYEKYNLLIDAERVYLEAIKIRPEERAVYAMLTRIYSKMDDYKNRNLYLQKYKELSQKGTLGDKKR